MTPIRGFGEMFIKANLDLFAHIVVYLDTLLHVVTKSMDILLDTNLQQEVSLQIEIKESFHRIMEFIWCILNLHIKFHRMSLSIMLFPTMEHIMLMLDLLLLLIILVETMSTIQ